MKVSFSGALVFQGGGKEISIPVGGQRFFVNGERYPLARESADGERGVGFSGIGEPVVVFISKQGEPGEVARLEMCGRWRGWER